MSTPQDKQLAMCNVLHDALVGAATDMLARAEVVLGEGNTASVLVLTVSHAVCEVCQVPHVLLSLVGSTESTPLKGITPDQILNCAQTLVATIGVDSARKH